MLHKTNILIHIIAGSVALLLGVFALVSAKGGRFHRKAGDWFLVCMSVVIVSGLMGVFVFKRNTFLLVITVLSGYFGYSGYRAVRMKSNRARALDVCVALASLGCVGYFLYYFRSIGMIWSPVIIYSTVGTLVLVVLYDFARYAIPREAYSGLWLYEHIFKMIGAFTALLSAFSGTVFYMYQPYSQFLPSVLGTLLQIGFIVYYASGMGTKKRGQLAPRS
ncbi:MAG TPA: hypothetical protein VL547_01960 [Dinghuibacter sp.]|jgi:hypothetical protein|uniref:hypothetical protein n=1 Tax=Dinghuibacter sp. TaxID=2024697 RepID=UPI002B5B6C82|nr:hypothetical protein [Dinghuibacter sp.]HTJ10755.1 hypothetical protein [Dinghuibacter sp.]